MNQIIELMRELRQKRNYFNVCIEVDSDGYTEISADTNIYSAHVKEKVVLILKDFDESKIISELKRLIKESK